MLIPNFGSESGDRELRVGVRVQLFFVGPGFKKILSQISLFSALYSEVSRSRKNWRLGDNVFLNPDSIKTKLGVTPTEPTLLLLSLVEYFRYHRRSDLVH